MTLIYPATGGCVPLYCGRLPPHLLQGLGNRH